MRIPATDRGARRANSFFALVPPEPVRDTIAGFRERLVAVLRGAGFDPDPRPWKPHLTLYRKLRTTPDTVSVDIGDWVVEDFVLLRTRSTQTGPVYRQEGAWKARREGV